jgi:uncharacterized protein
MILIRDADAAVTRQHARTRLTEIFSTRIVRFNKTAGDLKELHFTSLEEIRRIAGVHGMVMEVIRAEKHTSNVLLIIRKP